jgi:hypothetical protein
VRRRRLLLLILLALTLALAAVPRGAAAQTAPEEDVPPVAIEAEPSPEATPPAEADTRSGPTFDPVGLVVSLANPLVEYIADHLLVSFLQRVNAGLHGLVGAVLSSPLNVVTRTPPHLSYAHPKVENLAEQVRAVANAALLVVTLWGGINAIARPHFGFTYHTALEFLPRLAVGALLVNTSGSWTRLLIDLNNALCEAVGGGDLPVWNRIETGSSVLVDLAATLIYLIACGALVLQSLMRLALVDALVVVAPLGLACWVLPQTQGWARLWSSTFSAAVLTQFLQVVALSLGGDLLAQAAPDRADAGALAPFLGVAALALALKIPGLVRTQFGPGLAASPTQGSGTAAAAASGGTKAAGTQLVLPGFRRLLR